MKALRVILAAGALTAIAGSALAADEQVVKESGSTFPSYLDPVSVRAEVGTTGYGGAISYRVNPYVGLTLGSLYTTNFIGPLSYQAFSFLKLLALS